MVPVVNWVNVTTSPTILVIIALSGIFSPEMTSPTDIPDVENCVPNKLVIMVMLQ